MAIFIPSLEEIRNNRMEVPTEGEWYLLEKLKELSDRYEIYFQTHINVSHPDIVILRDGGGAIIIEVKDWNLDAYDFVGDFDKSPFGLMVERRGGCQIRNPFEQVHLYKEELFKMYSSALYVGNIKNSQTYAVVKTVVYFHNATEQEVEEKFGKDNCVEGKFKKNYMYWAKDSEKLVHNIRYLLNPNHLFTTEIYNQIKSILTPSLEWREQGESFILSKEQARFAVSTSGRRQKIKGVPGSGKTLVLAQRAVNCYERLKKPILILTFNITLKHYIRDKIAQITRNMEMTKLEKQYIFSIMHVHDFVQQMLSKYNIYYPYVEFDETDSEDILTKLLEDKLDTLKAMQSRIVYERYSAILIDEVQDFEYKWLKDIEQLFLEENGEFVLFGDEKQNIYNRIVDEEKLPKTTIGGRWSLLKESYRMPLEHGQLAQNFQKQYLKEKYSPSEIEYVQQNLYDYLTRSELRYYELEEKDRNLKNITEIIEHFRNDGTAISPNDICILSSNCASLRELEYYFRMQKQILSKSTCETKEEYDVFVRAFYAGRIKENEFKKKLWALRKIKKMAFRMNPGVIKLSTIHSFKGWEINSVVLLIDNRTETSLQDELIYTAITRTKRNLVIINVGNNRYREFFKRELDCYVRDIEGVWCKKEN